MIYGRSKECKIDCGIKVDFSHHTWINWHHISKSTFSAFRQLFIEKVYLSSWFFLYLATRFCCMSYVMSRMCCLRKYDNSEYELDMKQMYMLYISYVQLCNIILFLLHTSYKHEMVSFIDTASSPDKPGWMMPNSISLPTSYTHRLSISCIIIHCTQYFHYYVQVVFVYERVMCRGLRRNLRRYWSSLNLSITMMHVALMGVII